MNLSHIVYKRVLCLVSPLFNAPLRLLRVPTFALMGKNHFNAEAPSYPYDRPGQTT